MHVQVYSPSLMARPSKVVADPLNFLAGKMKEANPDIVQGALELPNDTEKIKTLKGVVAIWMRTLFAGAGITNGTNHEFVLGEIAEMLARHRWEFLPSSYKLKEKQRGFVPSVDMFIAENKERLVTLLDFLNSFSEQQGMPPGSMSHDPSSSSASFPSSASPKASSSAKRRPRTGTR